MKNLVSSLTSLKSNNQVELETQGEMKPTNFNEITVEHGATNIFELRFDERIATATYDRYNQKYIVVDTAGVLHCVDSHSHITCTHSLYYLIGNLVYNPIAKKFIGWTKGEPLLMVIDETLTEIAEVTSKTPVVALASSNFREEIVTADNKGVITNWTLKRSDDIKSPQLSPCRVFELSVPREVCHNPIVRVTCLALDKGGPHFNICLVAYSTNVAEISWDDDALVLKKQIHNTEVTAIFYNDVRGHIVTGAKDGTIKVWTSDWRLVCLLSGHVRNVVQVEACPMTPFLLMSASLDRSVRIWNVDAGLEVSRINMKGGAKGLVVHRFDRQFFVFGERMVSLWKMEQLLVLLTVLSSPVETLKVAVHPLLPSRLLTGCSNNSFNVLSMSTGSTVSSVKLEGKTDPHVATAVSAVEGIVLALLPGDKGLVRLPFDESNSELIDHWSHFPVPVTCITLYEHLVDIQALRRTIPDFSRSSRNPRARVMRTSGTMELSVASSRGRRQSTNLVLLFTGHADGRLRQIGIEDGTILASVSGHCGKILQLCHVAKMSHMLSLGSDENIRVWQVFPYSDVVLLPLKNIPLPGTPVLFSMLPHKVCVAFASKKILIYNLSNPVAVTHCPEDDHTDEICDLASLETQQVFASASKDKSVRLWSSGNKLLRVLKLDEIPSRIVFSSSKGDIIVAMWKHIFRLPFEKFLPASMLATRPQRLSISRGPPIETISEDRCYYMPEESLSLEKSVATDPSKMERDKILCYLAERNEDIKRIRDGKFPPRSFNEAASADLIYDDVFLKLFESVWGKYFKPPSKVELLSPPVGLVGKVDKRNSELLIASSSKKFFPSTVKMRTDNPVYDINKFRLGYIPNSILLKILWPEDDSWQAWKIWNKISLEKVAEAEEASIDDSEVKESYRETKKYQTCVIIRKGDYRYKNLIKRLEIVFAKMVPAGTTEFVPAADLSWLSAEEQRALYSEASKKWKILSVICCRGNHARKLCERASKIFYISRPTKDGIQGLESQYRLTFAEPKVRPRSGRMTPSISSVSSSPKGRTNAHKFCAPDMRRIPVSPARTVVTRSKEQPSDRGEMSSPRVDSLFDARSTMSTLSEASSLSTFDTTDRKPSFPPVPLVSLTVDEVIETLVKCADGMQRRQYSKTYTAKLLKGIGVIEADVLVEELQAWVKDVRQRRMINTMAEYYAKAIIWLKTWMLQYVRHVLVTMEELRRGQVTGRIHYSMVQLILQQNKGAALTPPLEDLTPQDEIYLLSLTCPDSPDQSLVETVKPVEVLNYFCEIFSEEKRQDEMKNLMKKSFTIIQSRSNNVAPGFCVDQSVQDITMVNKGCAVRHSNFGAWPKGIHLPLKMAEIVLFRKKESPRSEGKLLSYQTCNKHFVHTDSYT